VGDNMGINVALRDEHCNIIGEMITDFHGVISESLPCISDTRYCCIRFIDPYSDTIFNHIQAKTLLDEWDSLHESFVNKNAEQIWEDVCKLIAYCAGSEGIHHYIAFIGD